MRKYVLVAIVLIAVFLIMRKIIAVPVSEDLIDRIADAIARQEGFYVAGSRPARDNNPGNLTLDLGAGAPAVGMDGSLVIFATAGDGWANLQQEVRGWFNGSSSIYSAGMTIAQIASKYTATQVDEWAANVASFLGVTPDTVIGTLS